jgi:hypothetical protein
MASTFISVVELDLLQLLAVRHARHMGSDDVKHRSDLVKLLHAKGVTGVDSSDLKRWYYSWQLTPECRVAAASSSASSMSPSSTTTTTAAAAVASATCTSSSPDTGQGPWYVPPLSISATSSSSEDVIAVPAVPLRETTCVLADGTQFTLVAPAQAAAHYVLPPSMLTTAGGDTELAPASFRELDRFLRRLSQLQLSTELLKLVRSCRGRVHT